MKSGNLDPKNSGLKHERIKMHAGGSQISEYSFLRFTMTCRNCWWIGGLRSCQSTLVLKCLMEFRIRAALAQSIHADLRNRRAK